MACACRLLTWAYIPSLFACVLLLIGSADALGVNWGTMASHPLPPTIVANLLKDNKFTKVKLFDADSWTVTPLAGTGIEVMLAIPNNMLTTMGKYDNAKDWVKENVTKHIYDGGVNIKYVAVGNEPFLKSYNGSYLKTTLPALENIQKALNEAGLEKIKATVPLNADVYDSSSEKPSDGDFRPDIKGPMIEIVKFLDSNGSPFVVNIYPFLSLYANPDFPIDFAFFDGGGQTISDKNVTYDNVFDANFDTLVWSLKKAGAGDMKIKVGEIGWPTDGDKNANAKMAQRFYNGYFKKLASSKPGTPLRAEPVDAYLFGLLDEDQKSVAPGDFERHWGLFQYDGKPKFEVDFSGKGNPTLPVAAKGVQYMASQWCVLKKDEKTAQVVSNINYACSNSDCTSLGYGSSCNKLDFAGNISYGFNMYYQMQDQSVEACDFQGLAKVVTKNPSQDGCLFPVQIVSAAAGFGLGYSAAAAAIAGLVSLLALL